MLIERKYSFGGVVFCLRSDRKMLEDPRFEAFRVDPETAADYTYEIAAPAEGMQPKSNLPIAVQRSGNCIRAEMKLSLLPGISVANFLCSVNAAHLLPEKGKFILHASYVVHEGKAILFTAPSGTGKSTQARFWQTCRGADIANEDRVIIAAQNGEYFAHGCYAMGSAGVCKNITVPIRAIVILGQGRANRVTVPAPNEILRKILPQCTFDITGIADRIRMIDTVSSMIGKVPIVAYECINHESAVDELEKYI